MIGFFLADRSHSKSRSHRHLRAVEEDREDDPQEKQKVYIDSSVQDSKGLISLYLAAMAKEDVGAQLRPPGFQLPNLADLNQTEATWKAVAINYSFGSLNQGIPGCDSGNTCARYHSIMSFLQNQEISTVQMLALWPLKMETYFSIRSQV